MRVLVEEEGGANGQFYRDYPYKTFLSTIELVSIRILGRSRMVREVCGVSGVVDR